MRSYRSKSEGLPEMVKVKVAGVRMDRGWCVGSGLRTAGKKEALVGKLVRMELKHKRTSVKMCGNPGCYTIWLMILVAWDSSKSLIIRDPEQLGLFFLLLLFQNIL